MTIDGLVSAVFNPSLYVQHLQQHIENQWYLIFFSFNPLMSVVTQVSYILQQICSWAYLSLYALLVDTRRQMDFLKVLEI